MLYENESFQLNPEKMPKHVAIIMDGNGRWATKRGLPRKAGHKAGAGSSWKESFMPQRSLAWNI